MPNKTKPDTKPNTVDEWGNPIYDPNAVYPKTKPIDKIKEDEKEFYDKFGNDLVSVEQDQNSLYGGSTLSDDELITSEVWLWIEQKLRDREEEGYRTYKQLLKEAVLEAVELGRKTERKFYKTKGISPKKYESINETFTRHRNRLQQKFFTKTVLNLPKTNKPHDK